MQKLSLSVAHHAEQLTAASLALVAGAVNNAYALTNVALACSRWRGGIHLDNDHGTDRYSNPVPATLSRVVLGRSGGPNVSTLDDVLG